MGKVTRYRLSFLFKALATTVFLIAAFNYEMEVSNRLLLVATAYMLVSLAWLLAIQEVDKIDKRLPDPPSFDKAMELDQSYYEELRSDR